MDSASEIIRAIEGQPDRVYEILDCFWHWDRHEIREILDTVALHRKIDNEQWSELCTYYKC